jgi:acetyl-CoA C-acetyltransferase
MVVTAENVAKNYHVSREDQDAFAAESQRRTQKAKHEGRFQEEIVTVTVKEIKQTFEFSEDEHSRPETTIETLAKLRPIIKEYGTVTAGNACGRNDGAAAMIIMTADKAKLLNLKPIAKIVDWATSGVSPEIMGIGPIPAVKKLLKKTRIKVVRHRIVRTKRSICFSSLGGHKRTWARYRKSECKRRSYCTWTSSRRNWNEEHDNVNV